MLITGVTYGRFQRYGAPLQAPQFDTRVQGLGFRVFTDPQKSKATGVKPKLTALRDPGDTNGLVNLPPIGL